MKKIVALVLALMLALSMLTVATAETANPVAGKKVAYIMLLPSATIFQMWKDSCADLCAALDVEFDFSTSATVTSTAGWTPSTPAPPPAMTDCSSATATRTAPMCSSRS